MAEIHDRLIGRLAVVLASLHAVEPIASRLCEAGRHMLGADGAALSVMTSAGPTVVASTNELATQLEDLQDVVGEGPSKDAFQANEVQIADFTAEGGGRWSMMHEHGERLGFRGAMIALPLRPNIEAIGTLTAHRAAGRIPADLETANFLASAIGMALLQDPQLGMDDDTATEVWPSRAQIHQATGMVISQVGVRPEDALALLRGHAFANNLTLLEAAQQVVERHVNFRHFTIEGD